MECAGRAQPVRLRRNKDHAKARRQKIRLKNGKAGGGGRLDCASIIDATGVLVAVVAGANAGGRYPKGSKGWTKRERHQRAMRNKQMIVAAPDLYACVASLLANFPQLGTDEEISGADVIDWLNAELATWKKAVAKAEGRR